MQGHIENMGSRLGEHELGYGRGRQRCSGRHRILIWGHPRHGRIHNRNILDSQSILAIRSEGSVAEVHRVIISTKRHILKVVKSIIHLLDDVGVSAPTINSHGKGIAVR